MTSLESLQELVTYSYFCDRFREGVDTDFRSCDHIWDLQLKCWKK